MVGIWGSIAAGALVLGAITGVFYGGVTYGRLEVGAERDQALLNDAREVIKTQADLIDEGSGAVEREQANLLAIQKDLATIATRSSTIGTQLKSALNASNMATCVLTDDVRQLRVESYEAARAAADAANRARDPD